MWMNPQTPLPTGLYVFRSLRVEVSLCRAQYKGILYFVVVLSLACFLRLLAYGTSNSVLLCLNHKGSAQI